MEPIIIRVRGNSAEKVSGPIIVAKTVGYTVQFDLDSFWDDYDEIIPVFKGNTTLDGIPLGDDRTAIVPWEVVDEPHGLLKVGVFGDIATGAKKTPTVWATVGRICDGSVPEGSEGSEPSPAIWDSRGDSLEYSNDVLKLMSGSRVLDQVTIHDGQSSISWSNITNKPSTYPPSAHTHTTYEDHVEDDSIHITPAERAEWDAKQDEISDLDDIREGAEAGATAVQPAALNSYRTSSAQDTIDQTILDAIPTNVSELNNDAGYLTDAILEGYATEEYVDNHHDSTKEPLLPSTVGESGKVLTVGPSGDKIWAPASASVDEVEERLSLLEHMVLKNDITVPLATSDDTLTLITDHLGRAILSSRRYREEF